MRNTRRSCLRQRLLDYEKLSDAQLLFYMRRLWTVIPEKLRDRCMYVDPFWMWKFKEKEGEREEVLEWFKRFDLLKMKYVFFPICIWNHWILVILCNPGGDFNKKSKRPSMILLDSLNCCLKKDVENLMTSVLQMLYSDKMTSKIDLVCPEVPRQIDDKKCGFFVLYYMTLFFKVFPEKFSSHAGYPKFMTRDWFNLDELNNFQDLLSTIFNRIRSLTIDTMPIRIGQLVEGFDNDLETINLIKSCLGEKVEEFGHCKRIKKRKLEDSSDATEIIECNVIEQKNDEGSMSDGDSVNRTHNSSDGCKKLLMKMKPKIFNQVLDSLSTSQKTWIESSGFGKILNFRMIKYPLLLGYKLVSNFDHVMCCMSINGRAVSITDKDVEEVLGLPRGSRKVEFTRGDNLPVLWRRQYDVKDKSFRIHTREVAERIINSDNVDYNFKLNFLTLMITMLIQNPVNSFVRKKIIHFSGDIDKCSQYNWCEFLISSLKAAPKFWLRNPNTRYYCGSLPFLVFFYLNHAVPSEFLGIKLLPRYMSWKDFSLSKIENHLVEAKILEGGLKTPNVDKKILISWKNEEEVDEDNNLENVYDEMYVDSEADKEKDLLKDLETHYDVYDLACDKFLESLRNASQTQKKDSRFISLKEKFVDLNNVANWEAETIFDNPLANLYADKVNESRRARRGA